MASGRRVETSVVSISTAFLFVRSFVGPSVRLGALEVYTLAGNWHWHAYTVSYTYTHLVTSSVYIVHILSLPASAAAVPTLFFAL